MHHPEAVIAGTQIGQPTLTGDAQASQAKPPAPQLSIRNRRLNKLEREQAASLAALHSNQNTANDI